MSYKSLIPIFILVLTVISSCAETQYLVRQEWQSNESFEAFNGKMEKASENFFKGAIASDENPLQHPFLRLHKNCESHNAGSPSNYETCSLQIYWNSIDGSASPMWNVSGGVTTPHILDLEDQYIDEAYNYFLNNKNNMQTNYTLYHHIVSSWGYSEYNVMIGTTGKSLLVDAQLKEPYEKSHNDTFPTKNFNEYIDYIKNSNMPYTKKLLEYIYQFKDKWKQHIERANEINAYSVNYELVKKKGFKYGTDKKYLNYKLAGASIQSFLFAKGTTYGSAFNCAQHGYICNLISNEMGRIEVLQSLHNGVIVQLNVNGFGMMSFDPIPIFIETRKQFADGDKIDTQIYVVYDGFYHYTSVLQANKRILKFKEIEDPSKYVFYFINDKRSK